MRICRNCGQAVSEEWAATRRRIGGARTSAGLKSRKLRGLNVGRPREFDYNEIKELREEGFSLREIAKKVGCSTTVVQVAIKENIHETS